MAQTVTVCLPANQLYSVYPMARVNTVTWWCLLCASQGKATTEPLARSDAIEHLTVEHHATITGDSPAPPRHRW